MRIVLLNQYYLPAEAATAQLLADLGEELARAGHEVRVICGGRSYPEPIPIGPRRELLNGVVVLRSWTTGFGRSSRLGRIADYVTFLAGAIAHVACGPRPDLVVYLTTPPMLSLVGLALARLRRARSLYWVMDHYPELAFELGVLRREAWVGRLLERLAGYPLRRSSRVVALGETMAGRLEAAGATGVEVVHNWADGEAIRPRPALAHPLRRRWGLEQRFVVLYSGNMGLAHEFDTLLGAAELLRQDPHVLFLFIGTGPRRAAVEAAVRSRSLPNVQFRPFAERRDLAESLTAGDVHLLTLRESVAGLLVPSKIYGILAAGRPCLYVGPADGEVAEILRLGGCGVRIAVGDAAGLAQAALDYAADPERLEQEGRRARHLFDERFAKPRALAALRTLIESA